MRPIRGSERFEQVFAACGTSAVAILPERVGLVRFEDVEGQAARAGEHAGVGADARAVLPFAAVPSAVAAGTLSNSAQGDVAAAGGACSIVRCARTASAARTAVTGVFATWKAVLVEQRSSPVQALRAWTQRLTWMTAATCGCPSVSARVSGGSKTVTVRTVTIRRSSRLRPVSWAWTDPTGVVVAKTSRTRWRRVGWLSLSPTIRTMLAAWGCLFGSAARRAWPQCRVRRRVRPAGPTPPGSRWTSRRCRRARAPARCRRRMRSAPELRRGR